MKFQIFCPLALVFALAASSHADAGVFRAGFAQRDVTPQAATPMWGYGARNDALSEGVKDTLWAKALVIEAGGDKAALVGLDIGRGPTARQMERIRAEVREKAGVSWVLISGSHTHHGPVIELIDEPGKGQGRFDDAVAYADRLTDLLIEAIVEAAENAVDAKMGWGSADTDLNRNRHTRREPKPRDPELAVVRFDNLAGEQIALMVNFAAHPTILPYSDLRFSADWPGVMNNVLEARLNAPAFFLQGAAGDLSPNTSDQRRGIDGFGTAVAERTLEINKDIVTSVPEHPRIQAKLDTFTFDMRVDFSKPVVRGAFRMSFFDELLAFLDEMPDNKIHPEMTTLLLNGELALVTGSGEFFCQHANRLKAASKAPKTLFIGYCNGHHLYFPTLEGIEEGGYGADPAVAWAEPGAGEKMIDLALENIEELTAAFAASIAE